MTRVCSNHQVRTTPRGTGKLRAAYSIFRVRGSPRHSRIALLLPTPRCVTRVATQTGPRATHSSPDRRPATRSPGFITDAKHLRPPPPSGAAVRVSALLCAPLSPRASRSNPRHLPHSRCWEDATPVAAAHRHLSQFIHMFPQEGPLRTGREPYPDEITGILPHCRPRIAEK